MLRSALAALAAASMLGACAGDDGTTAATPPPDSAGVTTPERLDPEEPGAGLLVIDGVRYPFAVTACRSVPPTDPEVGVPVGVFELEGEGTGPGDEPFTVRASRFLTRAEADTFTDTVVLDQPGTGVHFVAERFEVNGLVTDLRDPTATSPLLRINPDQVSARGRFAPPGGTAAEGTSEGVLTAACPDPP